MNEELKEERKYRKVICPDCGFTTNIDSLFDYNCPKCYAILVDVKNPGGIV